ncbi:LacI family DNA-binding transcriptional regulator [Brevundimonas sp. R86498]|uniref:LacI family DNA-binding transcriptional regulator n=1 Tax=Brevundimonas sp. R86498 TaxID=3093845 RepID=UPI0037C76F02
MADIARLAGVATSTVSRALAESPMIPLETRREIQRIAAENGYVINLSAQRLRSSRTRTICVAIPLGHETDQLISDPFFLELFGHIADEVSARQFDVLLSRIPSPKPGWLTNHVQSQKADGYIVVGQSDQHEEINQAARTFLPLVVWGAHLPEQAYCSVGSDNIGGARAAVDTLLAAGRKRIVFLGAAALPEIQRRLEGYEAALHRAGIPLDPVLVQPAHFTGDTALAAVQSLIMRGVQFDAIFAASDVIALGALRALQASGLTVPGDVSVVGFDDLPLAEHAHPRLTTVHQDLKRGAAALVEFLFRRMDGEETPSATLPVRIIERDSVS